MILLLFFWYIFGVSSFIYWWTNEHNFSTGEVPMALIAGVLGPVAFLIGWSMHGDHNKILDKILVYKRKKSR